MFNAYIITLVGRPEIGIARPALGGKGGQENGYLVQIAGRAATWLNAESFKAIARQLNGTELELLSMTAAEAQIAAITDKKITPQLWPSDPVVFTDTADEIEARLKDDLEPATALTDNPAFDALRWLFQGDLCQEDFRALAAKGADKSLDRYVTSRTGHAEARKDIDDLMETPMPECQGEEKCDWIYNRTFELFYCKTCKRDQPEDPGWCEHEYAASMYNPATGSVEAECQKCGYAKQVTPV